MPMHNAALFKAKLTILSRIFYVFLILTRLWRFQRVQTVYVLSKNKEIIYPCKAQLVLFLLNVFGVGVSCRNLYSFVVYLYVNGSGSITSVGEERVNLSAVVYL